MPVACVRCGAVGPFEGEACTRCGGPLADDHAAATARGPAGRSYGMEGAESAEPVDPADARHAPASFMPRPVPAWLRLSLGTLATALISAAGAAAIYLVHRTMPELHPSFQARAPARSDTASANRALPQAAASPHAAPPKAQPTSTKPQQRSSNTRRRTGEPTSAPRG